MNSIHNLDINPKHSTLKRKLMIHFIFSVCIVCICAGYSAVLLFGRKTPEGTFLELFTALSITFLVVFNILAIFLEKWIQKILRKNDEKKEKIHAYFSARNETIETLKKHESASFDDRKKPSLFKAKTDQGEYFVEVENNNISIFEKK